MKRLHVHITVEDLAKSVRFYSTLFAKPADVVKEDYAKWMLDDPAVNFAVSDRCGKVGLNHLGFQVDSDQELAEIETRFKQAEYTGLKEANRNCCYAKSNKYWTMDPANIPWENFHTLDSIPTFGESAET